MDLKNPTNEHRAYHLWQSWLNAMAYAINDFNDPETESIFQEEDDGEQASTIANAVASIKTKVSSAAMAHIQLFDGEWYFATNEVRMMVKSQVINDDEHHPIIDAWLKRI